MKPLFDFFIKLFILSLVLWSTVYFAIDKASTDYYSLFLAWLMVVSNTVAGYLLFDYALDKDSSSFAKIVFGGLAIRMLLMMIAIALVIMNDLAVINDFVFSFFAFYAIYVIVEILGYQKKNKQKKISA